jgi:hypothetical protein
MNDQMNKKKMQNQKGLFKGEWIVILGIFIITGITTFFYTRSELAETTNSTVEKTTVVMTPTPSDHKEPTP